MPLPVAAAGMSAGTGALLGGIASGIGSLFGQSSANQTNIDIAREATQSNITSAREQMAFQKEMADTQYQRGAKDLEKAGINPILAFGKPGGMPAGASANAATTTVQDPITPALNSAKQGAMVARELMQQQKNLDLADAQIAKTLQEKRLTAAQATIAEKDVPISQAWKDIAERIFKTFGIGQSKPGQGDLFVPDKMRTITKDQFNSMGPAFRKALDQQQNSAKQKQPAFKGFSNPKGKI